MTAIQEVVADIMVDRMMCDGRKHQQPAPEWEQKHATMLAFLQEMAQARDAFQRIKDDRIIRAMDDFRAHAGGAAPARLREEYNDIMRRRGRTIAE